MEFGADAFALCRGVPMHVVVDLPTTEIAIAAVM